MDCVRTRDLMGDFSDRGSLSYSIWVLLQAFRKEFPVEPIVRVKVSTEFMTITSTGWEKSVICHIQARGKK